MNDTSAPDAGLLPFRDLINELDNDVMASFGAGQANYVAAATFDLPVLDGRSPHARQFLFKPVRPVALAEQSCRELGRQRPDGRKWSQ
ncbi:hypothetical protein ACF1BQ_031320 [Bradyrhizobium sp. RDT10]|uniref:hypothetical protein n=1 Tax=Bradyrhizobium TaxID=374 RepID=UPI000D3C67F0|nr:MULTISPECIES: hypothetical protein [Bradyrhizobium]MBT1516417.1 hypothetical protein [Bradyrhizobium sp. SRL28]